MIHRHPDSSGPLDFELVEYKGISSKLLTKGSWELQHHVNVRFAVKTFINYRIVIHYFYRFHLCVVNTSSQIVYVMDPDKQYMVDLLPADCHTFIYLEDTTTTLHFNCHGAVVTKL